MKKLSVCMIVKNETEILERCLKCLSFADEIIIVCTHDSPATKEIAAKYGEVHSFDWIDDFSAARNFSFSKATRDYILWCDADDYFPDSTISKLETLDLTADAYFLPYNMGFDADNQVTLSYYRERIVRRSCGFKWVEPVHEVMEVSGDIQYVDIPIEHRPGLFPGFLSSLYFYCLAAFWTHIYKYKFYRQAITFIFIKSNLFYFLILVLAKQLFKQ